MIKIKQTIVVGVLVAIAVATVQVVRATECGRKAGSQNEASCSACNSDKDCNIRYAYSDVGRTQSANVLCTCGQATEGCKDGTTKVDHVWYKKRTCPCTLPYAHTCDTCSTANDGDAAEVYETATSNTDCAY